MKTLYEGGRIHTMRGETEIVSSMGVKDDRIIWIGENSGEDWDERVDLKGMHVYPALTDSHLHLLYSIVLAANSFFVCQIGPEGVTPRNMAGIEKCIRDYCKKQLQKGILVANGYIASALEEKRLPSRQELDEWTDGRAFVLYSIDGHSSAMSTRLMEELGLSSRNHDGRFFGEEHEFMQGKVTNKIAASLTPAMLAKGVANFSNLCAYYGISRVCALDGNEDAGKKDVTTKLLSFLASRMDIDVRLFPQYTSMELARPYFKKQSHPRMGGCGAWELDGAVGSHSAAFSVPYKDDGRKGHCYYSDEEVRLRVAAALKEGVQLTCHAIGEDAISQIVDIYKELLPREEKRPEGPMMRVDHFEFPNREAVEAVSCLPLALTVQPGFSWVDKRYLKSYEQYLPEEKINQQLPLKELSQKGVCLCGSSDSPVQSIDPFAQMQGMTEFYLPKQSLSPYEALCTYTVNPARMLGEEADWGTLEPGKRADFMVMKVDLLNLKEEREEPLHAEYMVKDGKRWVPRRGTVPELLGLCLRKAKKL